VKRTIALGGHPLSQEPHGVHVHYDARLKALRASFTLGARTKCGFLFPWTSVLLERKPSQERLHGIRVIGKPSKQR
jgi:hypothetical protein